MAAPLCNKEELRRPSCIFNRHVLQESVSAEHVFKYSMILICETVSALCDTEGCYTQHVILEYFMDFGCLQTIITHQRSVL